MIRGLVASHASDGQAARTASRDEIGDGKADAVAIRMSAAKVGGVLEITIGPTMVRRPEVKAGADM